jgi:prophage DNA circulation protein
VAPRNEQREIETDRVERIAEEAARDAVEHNSTIPHWAKELIGKVDQVLDRLAKGDTAIALLEHRVAFLEKIVYGLCGFVLLAVLGGVVALVVRAHP